MNMPLGRNAAIAPPTFNISRHLVVAVTLSIALVAFEIFNYDTTEYALSSLMGHKMFAGLQWSAILAVAFCAIDFAGLARIFTPQKGWNEPKEVWYLMGAWLLGATMNAVMTWWAVSLTLLEHNFGNEVLSRQQLLQYVPIFVAALVWLTRILFIGALSVAGDHIFHFRAEARAVEKRQRQQKAVKKAAPRKQQASLRQTSQTRRRPVQQPLIEEDDELIIEPVQPRPHAEYTGESDAQNGLCSAESQSGSPALWPHQLSTDGRPEPQLRQLSIRPFSYLPTHFMKDRSHWLRSFSFGYASRRAAPLKERLSSPSAVIL